MPKFIGLTIFNLVFLFCSFGEVLYSQEQNLKVFVRDSVRNTAMVGSTVKLISGKDTSIRTTDNNGTCEFPVLRYQNSVMIVSYIGYKTKKIAIIPNIYSSSIDISMKEDIIELNQLIVRGDELMMIIKGDTLQYNLSALSTMDGDNLIEAIKMIPGVTVDGQGINHLGKPINRVYVNKTLLFGKENSLTALNNLKADEVRNVEIYDESTERDKFLGIENGEKYKVMNLITKQILELVANRKLSGGLGVEEDNNEKKYYLNGGVNMFSPKRTFETIFSSGNINAGILEDRVRNNSKRVLFTYTEKSIPRLEFHTSYNYEDNSTKYLNISNRIYNPSIRYESREYYDNKYNTKGDITNSADFRLDYIVDSLNMITVGLRAESKQNKEYSQQKGWIKEEKQILSMYNNSVYKNFMNSSLYPSIIWLHRLRKPGSSLLVRLIHNEGKTSGNGWQIDTSQVSTNKIHVENNMHGNNNNTTANITYGKYLGGGEISFSYEFIRGRNFSIRTSFDQFSGIIDTINTYDYTTNSIKHKGAVGYILNKGGSLLISSLGVSLNRNLRDEKFPDTYNYSKIYPGVESRVILKKELGTASSVDINYTGTTGVLSIEELRGVIDNSNPLFQRAGNPDLNPAYNQTAEIKYSHFTEKGSTISVTLSGTSIINGLAFKREYFKNDTYLAKYNYTIPKGVTLSTNVNVNSMFRSRINASYSLNWSFLKSLFTLSCSHSFRRTPFYIDEILNFQSNNVYDIDLNLRSNFSRKFNVSFTSGSSKGITSNSSGYSTGFFSQHFTSDVRATLLGRINVRNWMAYYYYNNPDIMGSKKNYLIWNLSIGLKVIKNKAEITLIGKDLFNNRSNLTTSVSEDYIQQAYNTDIIKRLFLISFILDLNTRK